MDWICSKCETQNTPTDSECAVCDCVRTKTPAHSASTSPKAAPRKVTTTSARTYSSPSAVRHIPKKKSSAGSWLAFALICVAVYMCYNAFGPLLFVKTPEESSAPLVASNQSSRPPTSSRPIRIITSPARKRVQRNIMGVWRGRFDGDDAVLSITKRTGNSFEGTLTTSDSAGTVQLSIEGVLPDDQRITFVETKVLRKPNKTNWTLGTNSGKFSQSSKMQGSGKNSVNPAYGWSFVHTFD